MLINRIRLKIYIVKAQKSPPEVSKYTQKPATPVVTALLMEGEYRQNRCEKKRINCGT
jgi:hypothetical protein